MSEDLAPMASGVCLTTLCFNPVSWKTRIWGEPWHSVIILPHNLE